jgi:hypothetical protein
MQDSRRATQAIPPREAPDLPFQPHLLCCLTVNAKQSFLHLSADRFILIVQRAEQSWHCRACIFADSFQTVCRYEACLRVAAR